MFGSNENEKDSCGSYNNNFCENNQGFVFGNNFASYPSNVVLYHKNLLNNLSTPYTLNNIKSGNSNLSLIIKIKDDDG